MLNLPQNNGIRLQRFIYSDETIITARDNVGGVCSASATPGTMQLKEGLWYKHAKLSIHGGRD